MRAVNRITVGVLIVLAVVWVSTFVVDLSHRLDDTIASERVFGKGAVHNPHDHRASEEFIAAIRRRGRNQMLRMYLVAAATAVVLLRSIVIVARSERYWNRRAAPSRPADPQAGRIIDEARSGGSIQMFRSQHAGLHFLPARRRELVIDLSSRSLIFRGFTFVRRFMGNKTEPEVGLTFGDILDVRIVSSQHGQSLSVRTTSGVVGIGGEIQPFQQLAAVLLDIAEVNRADPTAYAAALAREPKIKTPWYGWLIFAAALAVVAAIAAFFLHGG